jgi:hypothetical protein
VKNKRKPIKLKHFYVACVTVLQLVMVKAPELKPFATSYIGHATLSQTVMVEPPKVKPYPTLNMTQV